MISIISLKSLAPDSASGQALLRLMTTEILYTSLFCFLFVIVMM